MRSPRRPDVTSGLLAMTHWKQLQLIVIPSEAKESLS